jgi:hypothetical protein
MAVLARLGLGPRSRESHKGRSLHARELGISQAGQSHDFIGPGAVVSRSGLILQSAGTPGPQTFGWYGTSSSVTTFLGLAPRTLANDLRGQGSRVRL